MKNSIKYSALIFVVIVVVVLAITAMVRFNSYRQLKKCQNRVRYISSVLIAQEAKDRELPTSLNYSLLKSSESSEYGSAKTVNELKCCPSCHNEYIYSPITKSGETIKIETMGKRVILWCPHACHNNKRTVLLNSLEIRMLKDDDIDFSTQTTSD